MKFLIAVLSCWFCFVVGAPVAFATDDVSEDVTEEITTNVSERVTCADIKSELDSLEINDENQARIDKLKSEYRRFCTPKAAKRRASDTSAIMYAKTAQAKAAPVVIDVEPEKVEVSDENADAEVTTETTAVATVTDVAPDEKKSDTVTGKSVTRKSIELPVFLRYEFSLPAINKFLEPFIAIGPQWGWNLGDKDLKLYEGKTAKEEYKIKDSNLSLNLGLGAIVLDHVQFHINYNLALGKTSEYNIYDHAGDIITNKKSKTNTWQVSVAYIF